MPNPLPPGSLLLSLSPIGYGKEMADISDKLNPIRSFISKQHG